MWYGLYEVYASNIKLYSLPNWDFGYSELR